MSDSIFGKILKGTAKLACSYMTETAKSLSNNESYTEEARSQFSNIGDSFSDLRDRLDYTSQSLIDDDEYNYFDLTDDKQSEQTFEQKEQSSNFQTIKPKAVQSIFNQITFAGYQWYVLHRDNFHNTTLLLSKDIVKSMQFSSGIHPDFGSSLVYKWLRTDFYSELKSKLKSKDSDRLLSVSLLSSKEIEEYIPKSKSRVVSYSDASSEWWLSDEKKEFVKFVTSTGAISKRKPTDKCGVRPVIIIKSKEKSR